MSRNVLVLLFHPDITHSSVNRLMVDAVAGSGGIMLRDVYAHYPDFDIDVRTEQQLCESNDVLVFQHPIQWYGCPALMKEWIDRVLAYGWAHGPTGRQLHGKIWLSAVTAGWAESDYRAAGRNRRMLQDFLAPFAQTADHCGMRWLEPMTFYGARRAEPDRIRAHCERYCSYLVALRDETE